MEIGRQVIAGYNIVGDWQERRFIYIPDGGFNGLIFRPKLYIYCKVEKQIRKEQMKIFMKTKSDQKTQ